MRFQPKSLLAAALLALAASPALAVLLRYGVVRRAELLPVRSRARVLAFSCSLADITWFAVGASETPKNSLANSGDYWRA